MADLKADPLPDFSSALPEDVPSSSEVVYALKYPVKKSNEIEVALTFLAGDKFLSTNGISIDDRYHLTETIAIGLGFSLFRSSVTSEATDLSDRDIQPFVFDPSYMLRATVLYEPVYGKIAVGSSIFHFKLGVEAGAHLAHERQVLFSGNGYTNIDGISGQPLYSEAEGTRVGPMAGLRFQLFIAQHFTASASADFLMHSGLSINPYESGDSRKIWTFNFGAGYRF